MQDAEKYVDQKVAAIKSVALSHLIRDRASTSEPSKRQNRPSAKSGWKLEVLEVLEIQVVLDVDFSETVGCEDSIRICIANDIALAIGGVDPRKLHVRDLRAGSIIAEVILPKGCVTDGRNLQDVLEDLQLQLQVPESRLMNGNMTRYTINLCRITYHESAPLQAILDSAPATKSEVGGDLTAWAVDETVAIPEMESTERRMLANADEQRPDRDEPERSSWMPGTRVARNLFDNEPLGFREKSTDSSLMIDSNVVRGSRNLPDSASTTPRHMLNPAKIADIHVRAIDQPNHPRSSWRVASNALKPSVNLCRAVVWSPCHSHHNYLTVYAHESRSGRSYLKEHIGSRHLKINPRIIVCPVLTTLTTN